MIADTNNSFSNSMSSNSNSIVDSYTNSMANSNSNSSSNSSEPDHWKPNDKICIITPELIQQLSKIDNMNDLNKLTILDLHIKDGKKGKIRKIENMIYVPNLKQLNLSYNAITKIENLDRLRRLLELNLAENNIKTIENLDMLTSLTRLNLSGNQIERLPKSISQLRNLTNLRLARNKLYVVKDILYLKPIANLSKLYINDNPFYSMNYNKNVEKITTNSDQVSLYTIFNVQSLLYLNGLEINRGVREEAASYFIDNDTIYLREKLNEVNDQLRELKREINSSKYAKLSERLPTTKLEQLEFDEINKSLAIKLQQANELEEEANSLQIRLHQINQLQEENDIDDYYNSTQKDAKALKHAADDVPRFKSSPPKPHPYPQPSVSERDSYDTNNTSSKSFFSQAVRQSVPSKEDTAAGKQVAILSDRVEKLASKLLTADEEKAALARQLKKQNDEEKSSLLRQVEEERNDLIDKLEVLTEALDKSMKDKDRLLEMNDIITGELESAKHQLLTVAEEKNKLSKDLESKSVEFNSMKEELLRLRHAMVDNGMGSIVAQATGDANSGFTRAEDWRTHEARVEIAGQRVEIDSLKEENKKLKLDLENCMRQITHYSDSSLRSQQESEQLRSKSNYSEEFFKSSKNRIQELEQNNEKLVNQFAQLRNKNISYENENSQLKAAMAIMESEMDAYLRASNFRSKPSVSFGDSVLKSKKSKEHSFFESHSSTDSDSDDVGPIRSNSRSPTTASRVPAEEDGKSFGRSPKTKPTFTVSRLELAAAESMAHMLMEEIEKFGKQEYVADANSGVDSGRSRLLTKMDEFGSNFSGSTKKRYSANQSSTQPPRYALKEACVRAALRIVHTSVNIMREEQESSFSDSPAEESKARASLDKDASYNMMTPSQTPSSSQIHQSDRKKRKKLKNVEILPFHALGSREFLARIVAETQAGLAAIEDSDNLRIEQQKLQAINRDLETRSELLNATIRDKEEALATLQRHCDEAKSQAESTLSELDFLAKRMQMSRDEISKYDTEHTLIKREIELTRTNLQESLAMNEMEQKNVMYMRKKLEELKEEQRLVQNDLMLTKDELLKEDGKLRATKSLATDQLRLLQIDLNKIQNEFKSKQRAIDDLEKYRKAIEDETEIKRRDAETHLATLMREVDEETRKLSDVKSELRVGRLEVEQLVSKRRTLSTELARVGDALAIETNKLEAEEADAKRRLELLDRQLSDGEKNSRAIREKVSTFENEQILLRHSVDDLRRQQAELQRAAEMRRRAADEELNQSQLQAQLASRAARQATAQAEQKKAELEALEAELRTTARRYEEIKRQVREQEVILDTHRDAIKSIDQDRERVRKDSISIRKEEEELRYQSQLLRATIDNDTRALEDLRRRMTTLQDDEVNLKENEQKLKVSVASLRKAIEDSRTELDENRLASERERRALADLRTKKMMIESDLNRTEEECKFVHEQTSAESMKKNEVQSALIHAREEINRTQKELFLMQKKVADAKRLEEDLLHREEELKIQQEKLRVETEGWNTTLSNEKINVEKLREENRELMASLRSNAEELRAVQQELMSNKAELDGIKQHFNHFENLKLSLTKDLNRIRDSYRLEIKKMENLQDNYNSVEKQLKMLKSELEKMEQLYAKTRSLTIDEEERVNEQKRLLKATTYELSKLENEIASANKQMYEERQRALVEISQLGYAKQTAQQQLFLSSEAQKRIDKKSSSSSIADRAGSPPKVNSSKDFLVSKITNKLYPTNPKLSTTGVPLSASYSDYNSPFDTNTDLGFKSTAYSDSFPPRVIPLVNSRTISVERNRNNSSDVDKGGEVISSKNYAENFSESVGINDDEIELGSLQREVEKLRQQSAAVLNSTRK